MREIDELTQVDDPAWPELQEAFAAGAVPVRVLAADPAEGRRSVLQMQVTARSTLGALAWNCGGLVLDDGWVRVFGGGSEASGGLPSLAQVNRFPDAFDPDWSPEAGLVVGQDALGGVFALNGHDPAASGRPGSPGRMTYFAPDTLAWEAMDMGHSSWVHWLLSGRLETFYDGLRRPAGARRPPRWTSRRASPCTRSCGPRRPTRISPRTAGGPCRCAKSSEWPPTSPGSWVRPIRGSSATYE